MSGIVGGAGSKSGIIGETELPLPIATKYSFNVDKPGVGPYDVDEHTILLVHSDTTNGSTTFTNAVTGNPLTAVNGIAHSTAAYKHGTSSIKCEGGTTSGNSDHILWPYGPIPATADIGTGSYTIDCWIKFITAGDANMSDGAYAQLFCQGSGMAQLEVIFNAGKLGMWGHGISGVRGTTGWSSGNWTHLAIVRQAGSDGGAGEVLKCYRDGVENWSIGMTLNDIDFNDLSGPAYLFNNPGAWDRSLKAYIDEFRISKVARWQSDFPVS